MHVGKLRSSWFSTDQMWMASKSACVSKQYAIVLAELAILESSANKNSLHVLTFLWRSLMNAKNRQKPRDEPWITPDVTWVAADSALPYTTCWVRLVEIFSIQWIGCLATRRRASLSCNKLCCTLLKARAISSKLISTSALLFNQSAIAASQNNRLVSVE